MPEGGWHELSALPQGAMPSGTISPQSTLENKVLPCSVLKKKQEEVEGHQRPEQNGLHLSEMSPEASCWDGDSPCVTSVKMTFPPRARTDRFPPPSSVLSGEGASIHTICLSKQVVPSCGI